MTYDLEVDTSNASPMECANLITKIPAVVLDFIRNALLQRMDKRNDTSARIETSPRGRALEMAHRNATRMRRDARQDQYDDRTASNATSEQG